jgi:hypothetical protein
MHAGLAVIAAGVMYARNGARSAWAAALALAGLCVFNGNGWALLALPVAMLTTQVHVDVPRTGRLLLWLYPCHLWALYALKSWTGA